VLRISPSNASAWQNIWTIYLEQKDDAAARKAFTSALARSTRGSGQSRPTRASSTRCSTWE
jgi:Tfp pilus assembly protein PilF